MSSRTENPKAAPPPSQFPEGQWSTGICNCFDDPSNCLLTCFCPCITFGRVAEILDRGNTSCRLQGLVYYAMSHIGCAWLYGGVYRSKLRGFLSLPETPCADWLVHCCCCVCSLCQEYRELKNHGADPSLGNNYPFYWYHKTYLSLYVLHGQINLSDSTAKLLTGNYYSKMAYK
ncbi:hypothetical protein OIU77_014106 [Salix suchowensis]|uniref:Uncharacterized protein n=1 Tax=Salix suchowensis TaxID=1278906 RepID=A0ABQ8ZWW6_9ROSI|nr:hypothetical protein OIU77_014106 [Salix suchowensis]